MKRQFLGSLLVLPLLGFTALSQRRAPSPQPTPTAAPSPSPNKAAQESLIEIKLRTSRSQVTAGEGFGVVAEIKNKSDREVYLHPKYLTMIPPPEISTALYFYARMPPDGPNQNDHYEKVVPLGPGSTTTATWVGYGPGEDLNPSWWAKRFPLVSFTPGEYTMKVVGSYWTNRDDAAAKRDTYRTESSEINVIVAAPQWVIIIGAVIGGLIAFCLLPKARLHPERKDILGITWGIITSVLLSSIVTILLARLSETQFLVRVSINDLWGAVAIGFIASASGTTLLKRFVPEDKSERTSPAARVKQWMARRKKKSTPRLEKPAEPAGDDQAVG